MAKIRVSLSVLSNDLRALKYMELYARKTYQPVSIQHFSPIHADKRLRTDFSGPGHLRTNTVPKLVRGTETVDQLWDTWKLSFINGITEMYPPESTAPFCITTAKKNYCAISRCQTSQTWRFAQN